MASSDDPLDTAPPFEVLPLLRTETDVEFLGIAGYDPPTRRIIIRAGSPLHAWRVRLISQFGQPVIIPTSPPPLLQALIAGKQISTISVTVVDHSSGLVRLDPNIGMLGAGEYLMQILMVVPATPPNSPVVRYFPTDPVRLLIVE